MGYCTQSDILEQLDETTLIQLTDDNDAGVVDVSVVTRAIADADAEIDAYCEAHYDVSFDPVPAIIRKASVEISIYNLYTRRMGAPEERKYRYEKMIAFLDKVSKNQVSLGGDAPTMDDDSGPEATTSKSDRKFTMGRDSDSSTGTLDNY